MTLFSTLHIRLSTAFNNTPVVVNHGTHPLQSSVETPPKTELPTLSLSPAPEVNARQRNIIHSFASAALHCYGYPPLASAQLVLSTRWHDPLRRTIRPTHQMEGGSLHNNPHNHVCSHSRPLNLSTLDDQESETPNSYIPGRVARSQRNLQRRETRVLGLFPQHLGVAFLG
jgi:hypothetical protein